MSLSQRWREWRESGAEHAAAAEEMRFHIEQETEHNIRRGMSPQEARRAAGRAFGGVDRFAEAARDERTGARLSEFASSWLDWKLGGRMLAKHPGVTLIAGVTLALAIGLGAAWFEFSMMELFRQLPFADGERIVRIESWDAVTAEPEERSLHDYLEWREQLSSIDHLGAYRSYDRNLITTDGRARPVHVAEISPSAFPLTGVSPLLGRPLADEDAQPGAREVVVLGYDVWQTRFQGDRGIIGRAVRLGSGEATVVGVMPAGFRFPRHHQMWVPLRVTRVPPRAGPAIGVFGRLTDGASLERAQAELNTISERMAAALPDTHAQLRARVLPFAAPNRFDTQPGEALIINLIGWMILGAACANVATLMFARTAMRESEIVVRNALGASRMRIMGQLFIEALVLTAAAALAGLTALSLVLKLLLRKAVEYEVAIPFWYDDRIEPVTVLYTGVLAVAGATLIGLLPAIKATGPRVQAALTKLPGGTSMQFGGAWSVTIVLQVALSVILLAVGIDASRETLRDYRVRSGVVSDEILAFQPQLDRERTVGTMVEQSDAERRAYMQNVLNELTRRLRTDPAVAAVAFAQRLPGSGHPLRVVEAQRGGEPSFRVNANTEGQVRAAAVDVGFFDALQQPLVAGRGFHASDIIAVNSVAIINESLARNIGGNPVGVRVRYAAATEAAEPGPWHEVVGVVRNLGLEPTNRGEADFLYVPASAADVYPPAVIVRTRGEASSFEPGLRALAMQVEPALRLYDVVPLDEMIRRRDRPMLLATVAGIGVVLLAVILSAAGLYALMSVAVARRTREIGIRVAIGASRRAVLASVFRRAATQLGVGILVGNLLAVGLVLFFGGSLQPGTLLLPLLVSGIMALVGLLACLGPARRALRIQPTQALKEAR